MSVRYREVVIRTVQYKNAKIQDTRQLRQTRCFCFSHCLLEAIYLHHAQHTLDCTAPERQFENGA